MQSWPAQLLGTCQALGFQSPELVQGATLLGFHHCHDGDLLEELAQHLLAVNGWPVNPGCDGHSEGPFCVWQVGGGHDPVGAWRQEAEPAHLLGIAMRHAAQQRLLQQQWGCVLAPATLWDLRETRPVEKTRSRNSPGASFRKVLGTAR